jgi:hypothetical protein
MKKLFAILIPILIIGALPASLAYWSYKTTRWGGSYGYGQIEHELTFVDTAGNPVEGIELRVEDQQGNEFFCFPVTDYLPGQTPKTDKDGVIRFHHVSTAVEWDNYGWSLFWCFPVQTTKSPVYVCRFLRGNEELYGLRYDELPDWDWPGKGWEEVPKVKRPWNWPTMIPKEIRYKAEDTEESYFSRLRSFFHHDGDEVPSREVRVACRNARWLVEFRRDTEDIEFPVIRRTVTVKVPEAER